MTEEKDWGVPDDADVQLKVKTKIEAECPVKLGFRAKDAPVVNQVGLTIDQVAMLQAHLDELLDELENRPETRIREVNDDTTTKGVY